MTRESGRGALVVVRLVPFAATMLTAAISALFGRSPSSLLLGLAALVLAGITSLSPRTRLTTVVLLVLLAEYVVATHWLDAADRVATAAAEAALLYVVHLSSELSSFVPADAVVGPGVLARLARRSARGAAAGGAVAAGMCLVGSGTSGPAWIGLIGLGAGVVVVGALTVAFRPSG